MHDLAIVGAGPAGAAAALAARAARPDASVVLLDRAAFPRDKACGDGIAPHAVAVLARLGVVSAVSGYRRLTWFELSAGELSAGAPGERASVRAPLHGATYTVPRRVFDDRLVRAAVARGATLLRRRVRRVVMADGTVELDGVIAARVVIAADGANSRVRRTLGLPGNRSPALAIAMRGYAPTADRDGQRITLDERRWPAYGWSFAIGDGMANVGWGAIRDGGRVDGAALASRLAEMAGGDVADLRAHHLPLSTWRPPAARGRVLLAGDAASLINPLSGEGIFYALLSGMLAGRAAVLAADPGAAYASALRHRLGRHLAHTRLAARLIGRRRLRAAGIRAAASPAVFGQLADLALGDGLLTPGLATATLRHLVRA